MNDVTASPQRAPDILLIVHLDDSFIRGRLNTVANLTNERIPDLLSLLNATNNFEKPEATKSYRVFIDGMHDLTMLLQKIRSRIINISLQKTDTEIFLLNFTNQKNSKLIYTPIDHKLTEIENSGSILNKNLEQAKIFINYLYQNQILPYRRLAIEIVGVYRYACVNNIYQHLSNMIKEDKIPISVRINNDLSL